METTRNCSRETFNSLRQLFILIMAHQLIDFSEQWKVALDFDPTNPLKRRQGLAEMTWMWPPSGAPVIPYSFANGFRELLKLCLSNRTVMIIIFSGSVQTGGQRRDRILGRENMHQVQSIDPG